MSKDELSRILFHISSVVDVPIERTVKTYYLHRGLKMPSTAGEALHFLVSEIGELSDAYVQQAGGWVRNNPGKDRNVEDEVGDVLMMLYVFAMKLGIQPAVSMLQKMYKKIDLTTVDNSGNIESKGE